MLIAQGQAEGVRGKWVRYEDRQPKEVAAYTVYGYRVNDPSPTMFNMNWAGTWVAKSDSDMYCIIVFWLELYPVPALPVLGKHEWKWN